jgi:hypothetical protein
VRALDRDSLNPSYRDKVFASRWIIDEATMKITFHNVHNGQFSLRRLYAEFRCPFGSPGNAANSHKPDAWSFDPNAVVGVQQC